MAKVSDLFQGLMKHRVEWAPPIAHPSTLTRLTTDVCSAVSSPDEITVSAVNSRLPYLLAVLNESLRMYPPVTGSLVRVIAGEGATIAGRYIPGGTMVECAPWAIIILVRIGRIRGLSAGEPGLRRKATDSCQLGVLFDPRLADESRAWVEKQRAHPLWEKGPLNVYVAPVSR
ncbi:hypothetical protein V8F33_011362 [Rhypophila sp. PSN 637]